MKGLGKLLVFALAFSVPVMAQRGGRGAGRASSMGNRYASTRPARIGTSQSPSEILSRNTKLASKVQQLTGMPAQQACDGFKNVGLCVAAAHVSQNLPHVLFDDLKARMTGSGTDSLGQAIHYVDPSANAAAEAAKANKQAQKDIGQS